MKKFCELSSKILFAVPALVCVLIMRILRPLIVIRLGAIDVSRIGNMYGADWYLSEQVLPFHGGTSRRVDILYFVASENLICNQQWVKMWKRVLRTFPEGRFFKMVHRISMMFPGHQAHCVPMHHVSTITTPQKEKLKFILDSQKSHIAFTPQEESLGLQALKNLGVPENKPFVCFHARDAAYLKAVCPQRSWAYHDYRDSTIGNYISCVKELAKRGYSAVRMGAIVQEKLDLHNPDIIDYASSGRRSDFLDIYLGAKCEFFICSDTGISIIPEVFRRPAIYVNWAPVRRISPWVLNGLFIFKKFYSHREKRWLTFPELVHLNFDNPEDNFFIKQEIELRENTPEEITEVVIEMEERLKGKWVTTREDEELQERFWALFGPDRLKSPGLRIGAKFLRQHEEMISREFYNIGSIDGFKRS